MEKRNLLITEYDWPESYVYVPWPVDGLTREVLSKEQIQEKEKSIARARVLRGRKP